MKMFKLTWQGVTSERYQDEVYKFIKITIKIGSNYQKIMKSKIYTAKPVFFILNVNLTGTTKTVKHTCMKRYINYFLQI